MTHLGLEILDFGFCLRAWINKSLKIVPYFAMTAILIAQGRVKVRHRKNSRHCEEARRGNLPFFCLRSIDDTLLHSKPNKRINQSTHLPYLSLIRVTCIKGRFFILMKQ